MHATAPSDGEEGRLGNGQGNKKVVLQKKAQEAATRMAVLPEPLDGWRFPTVAVPTLRTNCGRLYCRFVAVCRRSPR